MTVKEITDWVDNLEELEAKDKVLLRNYILSKKKASRITAPQINIILKEQLKIT